MSERKEEKLSLIRIPKPTEPEPDFRRSAAYTSFAEKAVNQFLRANVPRAEILLPPERDLAGTARGIGKILKKKKVSDKIACRISKNRKLWLFKRE